MYSNNMLRARPDISPSMANRTVFRSKQQTYIFLYRHECEMVFRAHRSFYRNAIFCKLQLTQGNGVRASSHVTMSTSINKALHFRFLENGTVMLCIWMWTWSHDHLHEPHWGQPTIEHMSTINFCPMPGIWAR